MQQQPTGIHFSETMAGGVMCGESDYRSGEQMARVAGHMLVMHARVEIDDLEQFIDDPQHSGTLRGTIDYPPFGNSIPCDRGRFSLFSPAEMPQTKRMLYELGFVHAEVPFYLAGYKDIRDDPGFDLWSDTTTLYSRIHRGEDAAGDIVAAGILTLGMSGLMKLLAGMEVVHAQTAAERVSALNRFGHFFLGELWDSYAGVAGE